MVSLTSRLARMTGFLRPHCCWQLLVPLGVQIQKKAQAESGIRKQENLWWESKGVRGDHKETRMAGGPTWSFSLVGRLECNGAILTHRNLRLLGTSNSPASAFRGSTRVANCWTILKVLGKKPFLPFQLLVFGSSSSPASASLATGITDAHYHTWLILVFLIEMGFHHVGQAGLELLTSKDRGFSMLARLVSNSQPQVIRPPQPLKVLGLQGHIFAVVTLPGVCLNHSSFLHPQPYSRSTCSPALHFNDHVGDSIHPTAATFITCLSVFLGDGEVSCQSDHIGPLSSWEMLGMGMLKCQNAIIFTPPLNHPRFFRKL
ncbi:hypothetical protein AAY473_016077 [Plecturocebus cupreus]